MQRRPKVGLRSHLQRRLRALNIRRESTALRRVAESEAVAVGARRFALNVARVRDYAANERAVLASCRLEVANLRAARRRRHIVRFFLDDKRVNRC